MPDPTEKAIRELREAADEEHRPVITRADLPTLAAIAGIVVLFVLTIHALGAV